MILITPVRIIINMARYSTYRITPKAIELHCLPLEAGMEFKICLLAHKSLLSGEPRYFWNLHQSVPTSYLHSSASSRLVEPFLLSQLNFKPSLSHYATCTWNQRPYEVRTCDDLSTFKKKLITFFSKKHMIWKVLLAVFLLPVVDFLGRISLPAKTF